MRTDWLWHLIHTVWAIILCGKAFTNVKICHDTFEACWGSLSTIKIVWELGSCGYVWICWISMDIHGYPWISMDISGPPAEHIRLVVLDWISILEIHTYPCISNPWKIFRDIHILYPKVISLHYPCCYTSRYPYIYIFHFAYPCVFRWDLHIGYTNIFIQYIDVLTTYISK